MTTPNTTEEEKRMKTFIVRGPCFVPATATMEVRARDEQSAMRQAKRKFRSRSKILDVHDNTISSAEAFDWEPTSAEETI